jgi:hypothetical protein
VGGRGPRPLAGQHGSAAEGLSLVYRDGIAGREKAVESTPPPEEEILGNKTGETGKLPDVVILGTWVQYT